MGAVLAVATTGGMTIESVRGAITRCVLPPLIAGAQRVGLRRRNDINMAMALNKTPRADACAKKSAAVGNAIAARTIAPIIVMPIHGRLATGR